MTSATSKRTRFAALLVGGALVVSSLVAAAPVSSGITLAPELEDATAVRAGQAVEVGGQIELSGSSFIESAQLIAYGASGDEIGQQDVVFGLNRTEGEAFLDVDGDGNVTGRAELECLFGDATSDPLDQVQPSCDGQTESAWDVQLRMVVGGVAYFSDLLRVDPIAPIVESYQIVDNDTVIATFSEPVRHPTGTESTSDWNFRNGEAVVVAIEAGVDDCVYAADEDPRAGTSGCTRILTVSPPLAEDTTPRIDYFPRARGVHIDEAYNTVYLRSVSPSRGEFADSLAYDRVAPEPPVIDSIDGVPAEDPVTGERLVLSNQPQPDVVVGDVTDGNGVAVQVAAVDAGTGTASGTSATVTLDEPLADGVYEVTATELDTALCNPNDPGAGSCPNESEPSPTVVYDLDTVAPEPLGDALGRSTSITVSFTEAIAGLDDAAQWSVDNGLGTPITVTDVTDDGNGSDVRRLTITGGPVAPGALLTWTPPGADVYADEHGNEMAGFTISLVAAPLPVMTLATAPGDETPTGVLDETVPVTFTVNLSDPVAAGESASVDYNLLPIGSATIGTDVTDTSGTLVFNPGDDAMTVEVEVLQDELDEFDESVVLELTNASGAQFAGDGDSLRGIDTITDDDPAAQLSFVETDVEVVEGGEVTLTVSLDTVSGKDVRVDWATVFDGTASVSDAGEQSGQLSLPAGVTEASFTVGTLPDLDVEDGELFGIELSAPVNADIAAGRADVLVIDDDVLVPEMSVTGGSIDEDATGTISLLDPGLLTFEVSLSEAVNVPVTVDFTTTDAGSATAGDDFTATSGTLEFEPGDTVLLVEVPIADDELDEPDETVQLMLQDPNNATFVGGAVTLTADGTIVDDDDLAVVAFADPEVTVNEGDSATLTVELDVVSGKDVTVNWGNRYPGTAGQSDAPAQAGEVTIPAGATSATFTVDTTDDAVAEGDEDFAVELVAVENAALGDPVLATVVIVDDEVTLPTLSVEGGTVEEGSGLGGLTPASLEWTLTLDQMSDADVVVDVRTDAGGGTATAEDDFTGTSQTITIEAGQQSATVTVDVLDDDLDEFTESVALVVENVVNARLPGGVSQVVELGTITDDDPVVTVSLGEDVDVTEGDPATVEVLLSEVSGKPVTVSFETADSGATAGADYPATSGSVTIDAGETSATLTVPTTDDSEDEPDEDLTVSITVDSTESAVLGDGIATVTIVDDDVALGGVPTVGLTGAVVTEGDPVLSPGVPSTPMVFEVRLSEAASGDVEVSYRTLPGTADEGAIGDPADYVGQSGTVTIADGTDSAEITVDVFPDTVDEFDETFTLELTDVSGDAQLPGPTLSRTGRILDDDPLAVLGFDEDSLDVGVGEGDSTVLQVQLDGVTEKDATVAYAVSRDGSASAADVADQRGEVTVPAGATGVTITITTEADDIQEPSEDFSVVLSSPSGASLEDGRDVARVTILDDELPVPVVSLVGGSVDEDAAAAVGDESSSPLGENVAALAVPLDEPLVFTISLDAPAEQDVQVDYTTRDVGGATAGSDYAATSGTVTIPAGEQSAEVEVDVHDDALDEFDEQVALRLSDVVGGVLEGGGASLTATGLIVDDDPLVLVGLGDDVSVGEGESATFDVSLSAVSGKDVRVRYRTSDGSAVAGADYAATDGTLTIPAGSTTASFAVSTLDDAIDEPDEQLRVTLSVLSEDSAELGDGSATLEIVDDDLPLDPDSTVVFLTGDATEEGDPLTPLPLPVPGAQLSFTIGLSQPADGDVTLTYETRVGSATGQDFSPVTGTVTIPDGSSEAVVTVDVTGDLLDEFDEELRFAVTDVSGDAVLPGGELVRSGRILDDDPPAQLRVADATVLEGGVATVDVTLDNPSGKDITVAYRLVDGTATVGEDVRDASGTLSFPAGTTSRSVDVVTLADDDALEGIEQLTLQLSGPVNAGSDDPSGTISIVDVDAAGLPTATAVFLEDTEVVEQDTDVVTGVRVSLSSPRGEDTTVSWSSQQLTATAGEDYDADGGEVVIPAGETSALIPVTILGDDEIEPNEDFLVLLTEAEGAIVTGPSGRVTILDDDGDDDPDGGGGGGGGTPDGSLDPGAGGGQLPATGGGAGVGLLLMAGGLLVGRRRRDDD